MSWYIHALKKYAIFSGRARRKEFWMFSILNLFFMLLIPCWAGQFETGEPFFSVMLLVIYMLATLIPHMSVLIRRLHDSNKSGWFYLVSFIPFIGTFILFIFLCTKGTSGHNNYGPDPKSEYP